MHPAHPPKGMDGVPDHAAKFYGAGVLLAISYLHNEKNIAYRDMKPGTLFYSKCLILFSLLRLYDLLRMTMMNTLTQHATP